MKTRRGYYLVYLFFTVLSGAAQNANDGRNAEKITAVFYKMNAYSGDNKEKAVVPADVQLRLDEYKAARDNAEFGLYYTKSKSLFKAVEKLETSETSSQTLTALLGGGIRYCNAITKEKIKQLETLGEKFNIMIPFDEYKWNITTETKQINGYTCYKATSHKEEFSKFRNKTVTVDPFVWFTPEIPAPFGPIGLDGLPGLVLEGSANGKTYFYATKIVFDYQDKKVAIEKPAKGKYVTSAELEAIQIEAMSKN
jgi:GLPGLI family protein